MGTKSKGTAGDPQVLTDTNELEGFWHLRDHQMLEDRKILNLFESHLGHTEHGVPILRSTTDHPFWISNDAKVNFETALALISSFDPRFRMPLTVNPDADQREKMSKAERFALGIFRELDKRRRRVGGVVWHRDFAYWVLGGWYAVFTMVKRQGKSVQFLADLWDPITCYPEWDADKLVKLARKFEVDAKTGRTMLHDWQTEGADIATAGWPVSGQVNVINYFRDEDGKIFNEIRVGDVVVQSKFLKQFENKGIPVKIGGVGVQEKSSADWQMRWGESFIAANRQMYDHENTIWSLLAEIMRTQSFPNLLNMTRTGNASVRTEDVRGHGQVIPLKQGDTLDLLRNAAAPSEVFQLLDMIRVQKQKGSLPDIVFGSVPVELSGFAIAQLMAAIRFKVAPYLEVKDATMGDITTSLLEQYRDGDGTKAFPPVTLMTVDPKALRKGEFYVEDFKPSDVPDTTFVEVDTPITSALDKTQQIIFARQALEQPQLLSRETLWDDILEVQDAEQEKVRIAEDMLESNPLMQQLAILEAMQRKAEKLREAGMPTKAAIVEREIQQIELNLGLRQGILQQPGSPSGVPPNVLPPEMGTAPDLGIVPPGPVNRQPEGQPGRVVTPGSFGR